MMAKPWNEYQGTITKLYIKEGRTLKDVRDIMKLKYNFDASQVYLQETRRAPSPIRKQGSVSLPITVSCRHHHKTRRCKLAGFFVRLQLCKPTLIRAETSACAEAAHPLPKLFPGPDAVSR
ncbi:hypothetical protein LB505_006353 [Fusarium chuoi]|nr:hypothetical protein LB505_006353 [Fusarium chuoi]